MRDYGFDIVFPAIAVLFGMGWYKITSRRNRQFEPTLWWLFRWSYLLLVACCYIFGAIRSLALWRTNHPFVFLVGLTLAFVAVATVAAVDWRQSSLREHAGSRVTAASDESDR